MTTQPTILQHDTLEQAIQKVIRDDRVPKKVRSALEAYLAQSNKRGMGTMRSEKDTARVREIIGPSAEPYPCNSPGFASEDSFLLSCETIAIEQGLRITMEYSKESPEWSVDINGQRHERISSEVMEALIECAVIAAELSLKRESTRRPQ